MRAIKILKDEPQLLIPLQDLERELQYQKVAELIAEAQGFATPDRVEKCLEKLRSLQDRFDCDALHAVTHHIDERQNLASAHLELDIDRVLDLLSD